MADMATVIPQLESSTGAPEAVINALFDDCSGAMLFGINHQASAFLTLGLLGGRFGGTAVANQTVTLTASAMNYVVIHRTTLAATTSTSNTNWNNTTTYGRDYLFTMGAAEATNWEDHRWGAGGIFDTSAAGAAPSGAAGGDLAGTYPNPTVKTSVSLTTPNINVATATSVNKVAITAPASSATLTIANGKTLTASNSLTLAGTDGKTLTTSASLTLAGTDGKTLTVSNSIALAGTDSTTMTFPPASASIGYLNIPQNSQSTAYTTVLADAGKHLLHPAADTTARTFTIDSNANVAYPIGTAITFINQNAGGVITISITSDTMRLAGAGTTGSRTLAANGVATAIKITSTEWIISGTGLT